MYDMVGVHPSKPKQLTLPITSIKVDPDVWVEASTDWGIGVVLGQHWVGWRLKSSWKCEGRDIGWAEAIALKLAILWLLCDGYADCDIVIHGNYTGVIGSFYKAIHGTFLKMNHYITSHPTSSQAMFQFLQYM